jgi:hypothetical protein
MKAMFAKLGVASRPELTALVLYYTTPTSPKAGSADPRQPRLPTAS